MYQKLVNGGSGDGAASKQKALSGNIKVCVGDLQEPFSPHPRCSRSGAESDDNKNLAGGRESGVALHTRDREDDAELAVSHYICPGIAMKPMVYDSPPAQGAASRTNLKSVLLTRF